MNTYKKTATVFLRAAGFLAVSSCLACSKAPVEKVDGFIGFYALESYAQNLPLSRSPLKACAGDRFTLQLEITADSWNIFDFGGLIEGLRPTAAPNVYTIVPTKKSDPESGVQPYPAPGDTVEVLAGGREQVARLKWRGKTYSRIGSSLSNWTNEQLLAGEYTDQRGRKYLFTGDEEARWPDRTFSYRMELDIKHSLAPNCDFIRVKDKEEYIGYRWDGNKLLICHPEILTAEAGHPPLVNDGRMPFNCSSKPFLVLTRMK